MEKKGKVNKSYKNRLLLLHDRIIYYYKNEFALKPQARARKWQPGWGGGWLARWSGWLRCFALCEYDRRRGTR